MASPQGTPLRQVTTRFWQQHSHELELTQGFEEGVLPRGTEIWPSELAALHNTREWDPPPIGHSQPKPP